MAPVRWKATALIGTLVLILAILGSVAGQCQIPEGYTGDWYWMDNDGSDKIDIVNLNDWGDYVCEQIKIHKNPYPNIKGVNSTMLMKKKGDDICYICLDVLYRTENILQVKRSDCYSDNNDFQRKCKGYNQIPTVDQLKTYFRQTLKTVNCITTFEGMYQFSYEVSWGGGGICNNRDSQIKACQDPGSSYVDNEAFFMTYYRCPEVQTSYTQQKRYRCMGSWFAMVGQTGYTFAAIAEEVQKDKRERFKCLMTLKNQKSADNTIRWVMSRFAKCDTLNSMYVAPVRLVLTRTVLKPKNRHDVTCGQTDMSFSIPLDLHPMPTGATLSNPKCAVDTIGDRLNGSTLLNDCGTSVRFINDTFVFSNFVVLPSTNPNNKTSYVQNVIPIECRYNSTADLHLAYLPIVRRVLFTETGVGQFQFQIEQFQDASFASRISESSYPLKVSTSEKIYIQLSLADSVFEGKKEDYKMDVLKCVASSSSSIMAVQDENSQELIQDSCPANGDVHLVSGDQSEAGRRNTSLRHFRFSFKPVEFSNPANPQKSSAELVYVHCRVKLCPIQSCSTQGQCHQTSASTGQRVRRAVSDLGSSSGHNAHYLSTGPLLLMPDPQDATKRSMTSPVVMVMGAITALATLVAIAVIVAWTRSRRAEGHRLLKVASGEQ